MTTQNYCSCKKKKKSKDLLPPSVAHAVTKSGPKKCNEVQAHLEAIGIERKKILRMQKHLLNEFLINILRETVARRRLRMIQTAAANDRRKQMK
jgi:hypothetical protein